MRVIVAGATGRVGRVMMDGLGHQPDLTIVGGFGSAHALDDLARLAPEADVLVDFTTGQAAPAILQAAVGAGLHVVSGTSGLPPEALDALDTALRAAGRGGVWAANFAVGGALMMHFARVAARFMDSAEVIEMHHDRKVDAPVRDGDPDGARHSPGARRRPARSARRAPDAQGARAVTGGVRIHSVRLPGFNAHQEVLFGAPGQILSIRHDALGREAYLPGVALAVREAPNG